MSQAVYIAYRAHRPPNINSRSIVRLSQLLCPDNLTSSQPLIINSENTLIGVLNPSQDLNISESSVCLGTIFKENKDWWKVGAAAPDGSYALFRSDRDRIELLTDIVGSRTIWYVLTDTSFIASTSQRAIIFFLGRFQANEKVYPWMLSSGSLGPGLSWDRCIQHIPCDARLILNRNTWQVQINTSPVLFENNRRSYRECEQRLKYALESSLQHIELDQNRWILPLSGGYDSRAILLMLQRTPALKTVTWGLKNSLDNRHSDAYIAKKLAQYLHVKHQYFETEISDESIETIFNRFVRVGEGRIDHIGGYMDGFKMWKYFREQNYSGVIRGDQGLGWKSAHSEFDIRMSIGLTLLDDYIAFPFDGVQDLADTYKMNDGESLETYRDRLYHQFRIPFVVSALNEIKCAYVEVATPLLSRLVINEVRNLPDVMRTDKKLFKDIVDKISPNIDYASERSVGHSHNILKQPNVVAFLHDELVSSMDSGLFSRDFLGNVLSNLIVDTSTTRRNKIGIKRAIKSLLPERILHLIRRKQSKLSPDYNTIAFRIFIISKMHEILKADSCALNHDT